MFSPDPEVWRHAIADWDIVKPKSNFKSRHQITGVDCDFAPSTLFIIRKPRKKIQEHLSCLPWVLRTQVLIFRLNHSILQVDYRFYTTCPY